MRAVGRRAHRPVRQEGAIRPAGFLAIGSALLSVGCNSGRIPLPEESIKAEEEAKAKAGTETRRVRSEGGSLDRISDDGKRMKLWSVSWGSATLEYTTDQQFGGRMMDVRGTVYEKGVEASTFVAKEAVADKGSSQLKLIGGVVVKSVKHGGMLRCGEMVYDGVKGVIEAKGGIDADYRDYVLRGLEHVKAKADLEVVATPDMYDWKAKL